MEDDDELQNGEVVVLPASCRKKRCGERKLLKRRHWRVDEDEKLKALVATNGPRNWSNMAKYLHGRTGKSCRLRWVNQLDPRINKELFTEEEDEELLAAHAAYGSKWAKIACLFPGRTDNALKNHWHLLMARRHTPIITTTTSSSSSNSTPTQLPTINNLLLLHQSPRSMGRSVVNTTTTLVQQQHSDSCAHSSSVPVDSSAHHFHHHHHQHQRINVPTFIDFLGVGDAN